MPDIAHTESEVEIGIVTALQGDDAIVEIMGQEICETCGARLVCRPDQSGKRGNQTYRNSKEIVRDIALCNRV